MKTVIFSSKEPYEVPFSEATNLITTHSLCQDSPGGGENEQPIGGNDDL